MGFSSMFQRGVRVVAFVAIVCLSLQVACTIGVPLLTSAQDVAHGDGGCHESAPTQPQRPDSRHVCCGGDHFPDALLSVAVTPAPLSLNGNLLGLTTALRSFPPFYTDFPASFSPPHKPLALRI